MKIEIKRNSNLQLVACGFCPVDPCDSNGTWHPALASKLIEKSRNRLSDYRILNGQIVHEFWFEMDDNEPVKTLESRIMAIQEKAQKEFSRELDALLALKEQLEVLKEGESI